MLPSVFAFSMQRNPRAQPTRHKITCGLLDVLACKHCRRARKAAPNGKQSPPTDSKRSSSSPGKKSKEESKMKTQKEELGRRNTKDMLPRSDKGHETLRPSNLILMRRQSLSTSNLPDAITSGLSYSSSSILKTSPNFAERKRLASDPNLKKQARFSESVSVIVHDLETQQVLKDQVRLKAPVHTCAEASTKKSRGFKDSDLKRLSEKPFELDSMEVEYVGSRGHLKVVVFLGEEFLNERVEIHTARLGQSLVVVAYKPEPLGDGTDYFRRFMQRFRLSEPVDPYAIKATLLSRGYVKIRAPLLGQDEENEAIRTT